MSFEGLNFLTVRSRNLGGRADISLFVPLEARSLRNAPMVLLLHGAHGSHWNWPITGRAHRTAHRLITEGRIPPVALVMPSDGLWGDGSGYVPHARQNFEQWIVEEVPQAVRPMAACLTEQSPLFLCGLSMGGFGALRIGAKYPGRYRGLSAHSSITHLEQMKAYVEQDPSLSGVAPENLSVLDTMLRNREGLPPFRFDCGVEDPLLKHNQQLHRDLETHGIAHRYEEFAGGHNWIYWIRHLENSLLFFGEILNGQIKS